MHALQTTTQIPNVYDYPVTVQTHVERWRAVSDVVRREGRPGMVRIAREFGWSEKTIYRKLAAWRASGERDWTVFIDSRQFPHLWDRAERQTVLPREFIRWAAGRMLANQRASEPAHRAILAQWRRWRAGDPAAAIPGYATCPAVGCNGKHPQGWSMPNLVRRCKNTKAELAIARVGTVAARQYLPCVPGTREGARYLEYIFFDDVVNDRLALVPGYLNAVRVLQLGGIDLATAYYLKFGQRPDLPGEDGVRDRLKRRDFLWLVASLLDEYGYPADYDMHLIVERGTATMSQAEARVLHDVSDGRIKVCYTSMEGQLVLAWDEGKTGNSRGKALIESFHNLWHNEQAGYTGQVGKDRNHCPAALAGIEREVLSLQKVGAMLPPEVRSRLRMPVPSMAEFYLQSLDVAARINRRTDHECEGFADVLLWRLPGTREWREEKELVNVAPDMISQLEFIPRKESPAERLERLSQGVPLRRLPRNIWPRFYEDSHDLARVHCAQIQVKTGGRSLLFAPETPETAVADGTELLAYFAPLDPKVVHLTENGRYIGSWPRLDRVRRGDAATASIGIRRKQIFLNHAVASVQTKRAEDILREDRRVTENLELVADAGLRANHETTLTAGAAGLQQINTQMSTAKTRAITQREYEALAEAADLASAK